MKLRTLLTSALAVSGLQFTAPAADLYWGGDASSSFQTLGNWWADLNRSTAATAIPGAADVAIFNALAPVPSQIATLGADTTLLGLVFNGSSGTAITLGTLNDHLLTLGTSGLSIEAGAAAHTLNSAVAINTSQTWSNLSNQLFTQAGNVSFASPANQTLEISGTGGFAITGPITATANRRLAITSSGPVTLGDISSTAVLTFDVADGLNPAITGTISGSGSIHKEGSGKLTLSGANSLTGTIRLLEGEVVIAKSNTANSQTIFGLASGAPGSNGFGTLTLDNSTEDVNYRTNTLYVHATSDGGIITSTGGSFEATLSLNANRNFIINDSTAEIDLLVTVGIANGDANARTLTKQSIGTMVMQGANTYTGATNVDRGKLILDYSLNNGDNKLSNSATTSLRGGHLELLGNSSAATTEVANALAVTNGSNVLALTSQGGQEVTFTLNGNLSRSTGTGVLDIQSNAPALTHFIVGGTPANNADGFLGGWATYNGSRWATRNGSNEIVALAGTVQNDKGLWSAGENIIMDAASTGALVTPEVASLILDSAAGGALILDNNARALTLTSSAILVSSNVTGDTSIEGGQILTRNSAVTATNELIITNHSTGKLTVGANLGGSNTLLSAIQHITLGGAGVIELAGSNSYSGNLYVQGNVKVSGGDAINDYRNTILATGGSMTENGALLDLDGGSEGIGNLSGGSAAENTYLSNGPGEVRLGTGGALTLNQTADSTYNGMFTGSGVITKRGNRTLTLAVNTHSFTGEVVVEGGSITANGAGTAFGSISTLRLRGGSFTSGQSATSATNKINNSATVILEGTSGNGLHILSSVNGARTETSSRLTLGGGANTLTVENTVTPSATFSTATATLAFGSGNPSFSRLNGATMLVRGTNLAGTASASTVATRVTFSNTTAINAAHIGTSTATTQSSSVTTLKILPFGIGENDVAGVGNSFLTYATTLGLRPLAESEYATVYGSAAADDNLSLSGSATGLAEKTFNSLRLVNSSGTDPLALTGTGSLTLTSGGLLFHAGATENDATVDGFSQILAGNSAGTDDELVVFVTSSAGAAAGATLTLNSGIADNGGATSLTKSGAGTLILGGVNTYTGTTTVNEGVLQFGQSTGTLGSGSLRLAGGTLRWAAGNTTDITAGARSVELLGASVYLTPGSAGTTSTGGNILFAGSTLDVGSNNVTLTAAIGENGYGGLTKMGTGTLTLNSAPTYTGTTLIAEGAMNFQTIAPGTMEGLYLASRNGGATLSSTIQDGLNVQQLIVAGVYGNPGVNTPGVTATLTVNGGAVNIGSGAGDDFVLIGYRDTTAGVATSFTTGTVDFSAASSVTLNVSSLELGTFYGAVSSPNSRTSSGSLLLSNTLNHITAGKIILGNSPASVVNVSPASSINLGTGTTTIHTDTLVIGGSRSAGTITLGSGGSFTLRGQQGGSTGANLFIGDNDSNGSTGTNNVSSLTLTGASLVDLKINLLILGRVSIANTSGGYGRGTLSFDTGLIEATTILMADPNYSSGTDNNIANTIGTINQSGDAVFRFMELSRGKGTAVWNWQGGTLQNISGADQTNENVNFTLNGSGDANNPALRTYEVDEDRTATFESAAALTGAGSFSKEGEGSLALHGVNTNLGNVLIAEGSLALHGSGSMDDAAWFNVGTAGTLDVTARTASSYTSDAVISGTGTLKATGGSFTIGSNVGSVNADGVLKPGSSSSIGTAASAATVGDLTGTLHIEGALVLGGNAVRVDRAVLQAGSTDRNAAATLDTLHGGNLATWVDNIPADFAAFMTGAGSGHDLITISDGLTLNENGGITITDYDGYSGQFGDVFNFLDWSSLAGLTNNGFDAGPRYQTGIETGHDLTLFTLTPGLQWDTSLFLSNGVLVVVPEPSRMLLLFIALAACTFRRRRV
ncbi:autotransporter-associated beta strand repeat-containing protein [Prosthecobacter sp. SYSU 5D2]|uniref:autotransporter-associated beta strand repeat-containing protein n=1 Tax=Prosthecobacter sp. SYSU 5D2 TaxID=3134134 RepID=UPI0031FEE3F7